MGEALDLGDTMENETDMDPALGTCGSVPGDHYSCAVRALHEVSRGE